MTTQHRRLAARRARAGFTINEILFATAIMTIVLLSSFLVMQRDVQLQRSSLSIAVAESKAQAMLFKLQQELTDARGETPRATLAFALGPGEVTAQVAPGAAEPGAPEGTEGFPDRGFLLIDRAGGRELAGYTGHFGTTTFTGLDRGLQCTPANNHATGDEVLWAGVAVPIVNQVNPPASAFDGQTQMPTGPVFYEGLGIGFSYRVPTDPAGGTDFLDDEDNLTWGETVNGVPTLTGWSAVQFNPVWVFEEAAEGTDLNGDGDQDDSFDVGQLRRRTWDTANPGVPGADVGLGPTVVLQERCNWGGDLDGDGFSDPMFLWDEARRTLHVRLFVLGTARGSAAIVRRVEASVFLRNMIDA